MADVLGSDDGVEIGAQFGDRQNELDLRTQGTRPDRRGQRIGLRPQTGKQLPHAGKDLYPIANQLTECAFLVGHQTCHHAVVRVSALVLEHGHEAVVVVQAEVTFEVVGLGHGDVEHG